MTKILNNHNENIKHVYHYVASHCKSFVSGLQVKCSQYITSNVGSLIKTCLRLSLYSVAYQAPKWHHVEKDSN